MVPERTNYRYDIFVSFAAADRDWVQGYLLPTLALSSERVITSQPTSGSASFQLGAAIVSEFERAVTDSRFTVLVLSGAYLTDEWSAFGEQLASFVTVAEQQNRLIPLLRERDRTLPLRIDFRVRLDCTEQRNWEAELGRLRRLLTQPEPKPERISCPYPGMVPFQAKDARFFYGRENEIRMMLQHFRNQRLLFVIGPSGCGKSSLVFAGLLPQLQSSAYFDEGFWQVKQMRPGAHPLQELGTVLDGDASIASVGKLLATTSPAQRLLLAVDQFEELFSQAERAEQSGFIAALQALRSVDNCALLITMRADFYPELMNSDLWTEALSHRMEVAPLRGAALRKAVEEPAEQMGVYLERGLAERLVRDAAEEPGALPLLQETMRLLWAEMARRFLPIESYERLGAGSRSGLAVAIANKADATLNDFPSAEQKVIARRIFLRLVQFGEGRPDTRRQQLVASLRSERDDQQLFDQTLRYLEDNRLVTVTGEEGESEKKVDLAHEALIVGWPQLQQWVSERRGAEQTRRRLQGKAEEWIRLGRQKGGLLDEFELAEVNHWLSSVDALELGQTLTLNDFIESSHKSLDEQREHDRRIQGELRLALENERQASYFANIALAERYWLSNQPDRAEETLSLCHESLRQWEWHYLKRLCNSELLRITLEAPVTSLAVTADGQTLACGLDNGRVLLSDSFDGALLKEIIIGEAPIVAVTFSRSGTHVAAGAKANKWGNSRGDLVTFELPLTGEPKVLLQANDGVPAISFDPSGECIAAVDGRFVTLFDVSTYHSTAQFEHRRCHNLAFSSNGCWIASVARSPNFIDDGKIGLVKTWNLSTKEECSTFNGRELTCLSFVPGSATLITASESKIVAFDALTGITKFTIRTHAERVTALAVSPDARLIASAGQEGVIELWDIEEPEKPPTVYIGHVGEVTAVTFSSDCERLFSAGADRTVRVWDATTEQRSLTYLYGLEANKFTYPTGVDHISTASSVRAGLSQDGTVYASAGLTVVIRDTRIGAKKLHLDRNIDTVSSHICLSPSKERLALFVRWSLFENTGILRIVDTTGAELDYSIQAHAVYISDVAFRPGRDQLATCGVDENEARERQLIKLWDYKLQSTQFEIHYNGEPVDRIAFSPDGTHLAGANSEFVAIWDVRTGLELTRYPGSGEQVGSVAFSPDGRYFAVGSAGPTPSIRVWDRTKVDAGLTSLKGHTEAITSLAFSSNGSRLASGSADKTARVWAVLEGREVLTLKGHDAKILTVAFESASGALLSASADGTLKMWRSSPRSRQAIGKSTFPEYGIGEWHLRRAENAIRQKHLEAALLHLQATRDSFVSEPEFLESRARLYTMVDQWDNASRDLEQSITSGKRPMWVWHWIALIAVYQKRNQFYEEICQQLAQERGLGEDLNSRIMIRTCCVGPHNVNTRSDEEGEGWWNKIVTRAAQLSQKQSAAGWNLFGAVLYRSARFEDAIEQLNSFVEDSPWWSLWNQLFLAMSYVHSERRRDAEHILNGVKRVLNPEPGEPISGFSGTERLELQTLLDEAVSLIELQ